MQLTHARNDSLAEKKTPVSHQSHQHNNAGRQVHMQPKQLTVNVWLRNSQSQMSPI
jgi:hypothetical protein